MPKKFAVQTGRVVAGAIATIALVGLGGGVASADEDTPSGTIQEVGETVSGVEESTGVAEVSDEVGESTGVSDVEEEAGVTKAEEGLGLG